MKQHNCINRSPKLKTTPLLLAQTDTSTLFMKNTLIPFLIQKIHKCLPPTKPPAVLVHLSNRSPCWSELGMRQCRVSRRSRHERYSHIPVQEASGKRMGRGNGCFKGWVFNGWPKFGFIWCVWPVAGFFILFFQKKWQLRSDSFLQDGQCIFKNWLETLGRKIRKGQEHYSDGND